MMLQANRQRIIIGFFVILAFFILLRLFVIQIVNHSFYVAVAEGTHEIFKIINPERGNIWIHDSDKLFPLAINRDFFTLIADARKLQEPKNTAEKIASIIGIDAEEKYDLFLKLEEGGKNKDPYIIIADKLNEELKNKIEKENIDGLYLLRKANRFYPENEIGAHVAGFYGSDNAGNLKGRYGVEGKYDEILSGKEGYVKGERDAFGAWIPIATRNIYEATNGADIVLTIERTLQYKVCKTLDAHAKEFGAAGASAVLMDPHSGKILAMCNYPSFDPNFYNQVKKIETYNNDAIFKSYEPGSVFKPVTMAAAIEEDAVSPETEYVDEGFVKYGEHIIKNAVEKKYGKQNMTQVLEQSINTGVIFVTEKLGKNAFRDYVKKFGFGQKTGIELVGESAGDISSLEKKGDIFTATASFGQGITVTLLQIAAAFSAIANGGTLYSPIIIDEIRYTDGTVVKNTPLANERVISDRTSRLISGMLVSVVENGHGKPARVKGYRIAGKTGTAEIPGPGGYTEDTNQTFAGFAPADDPKFVLVVKYERPKRGFAEYTAAPTFGNLAKFLLNYYRVPATYNL